MLTAYTIGAVATGTLLAATTRPGPIHRDRATAILLAALLWPATLLAVIAIATTRAHHR